MSSCKIQMPSKYGKSLEHKDVFFKIIHNGIEGEELKYEGEKGDLKINLICDEGAASGLMVKNDGFANLICSDGSLEITKLGNNTFDVRVSQDFINSCLINLINNNLQQT